MCRHHASRVLLVDDDPAILRLLETKLTKAGYVAESYTEGESAFQAIVQSPPEFIVTDWEMPNVDGIELCHRIRALRLPNYIYIIILTGRTGSAELIRGFEAGADDFITKERFSFDELLARLVAGKRIIGLERRLQQMAKTDALTGLVNRRSFLEQAQNEWERTSRYGLQLSFVMIDIDFFKRVNDNHGHATGDLVLRRVADLLGDRSRSTECIGRYGGEEFCVMLPETDQWGAVRWAERVRERIAVETFPIEGGVLNITASFGVAEKRDKRETVEMLIDQADQALLAAKEAGRNRVVCFETLSACEGGKVAEPGGLAPMFRGVTAADVMTPLSEVLGESSSVGEAGELFLRSRSSTIPVVDFEGKLIGAVAEKDILTTLTRPDSLQRSIAQLDLIRPNVISYEDDTPARNVFDFFSRVTLSRVIILHQGSPVGTVSRTGLLRWVCNRLAALESEDGRLLAVLDEQERRKQIHHLTRLIHEYAAKLQQECRLHNSILTDSAVQNVTRLQELLDRMWKWRGDVLTGVCL